MSAHWPGQQLKQAPCPRSRLLVHVTGEACVVAAPVVSSDPNLLNLFRISLTRISWTKGDGVLRSIR
jgi:hypothetical protein